MNGKVTLAATTLVLSLTHASSALAQYVVQIPIDSLLDGRSVSTLTGGAVVPWVAGQGVYNDGCCGAYATAAVKAKLAPNAAGLGLPDDGLFPATAPLPAFQLHFSNAAPATSPQTHQVHQTTGPQSFQFAVPPAIYSTLFLILTASEGTANFTVTLSYGGGAPSTMTNIMLPDSGIGVQMGGSAHFYLITATGKWNTTGMDVEPTGHTIEGIQITPSASAMLTGVQITKTNAAHLVFWGATGIATTPVDAGAEMPLDSGVAGGGSDASGAGAEASTGTTSGATGSSGTASGASATSGVATAGTSSGAGGGTAGSSATGSMASSATTSTGPSGAASQSGSSGNTSGSNATTSPSSASSGSGCAFAPASGRSAGWNALAVVGLMLGARRRRERSPQCLATGPPARDCRATDPATSPPPGERGRSRRRGRRRR